jgi:hypothetical protein
MERNGMRVGACVNACCAVCAKADFIGKHLLVDKSEAEETADSREGVIAEPG